MHPETRRWPFALPCALAAFASAAAGQTISNGDYAVRLDPIGVMVAPPAEGLCTTYGPMIEFTRGTAEWFGVSFDRLGGHVSAVGAGPIADYARRTPVTPVSSSFTAGGAVMVSSVGALEIEHTFSFCPFTGALVIGVTLRNNGKAPITNVVYSREWRNDTLVGGTFPVEWAPALPPGPSDVWRMAWMPNNILPGTTQGAVLAVHSTLYSPSSGLGPAADDVPLRLWTNSRFPTGLVFGNTYGISFGDYDHDGWIDVVNADGEALWRNLGGSDWVKQVDLSTWMTKITRYGCAMADYDGDQLLDICDEPRSGGAFFLHALGNDLFEEVAGNPAIVDVRPQAPCETNSVADVDGDSYLDWFFPVYPDWIGGPGNYFLHNQGPDANGVYSFKELSGPAGLDNPPQPVNRPEGAEFVDVDLDGDLDLYCNNTIYRNVSTQGNPLFEAMTENGSGVVFSNVLDEGGGFLDYDMDGDMDLCLAFCDSTKGVRMFESKGDGTFVVQPKSVFDSFNTGLCLGLSFEDWDNDGDIDVTSSEVFRRNQFQESGGDRHFTVATHSIPAGHVTDATPAWGDFDKDGDLDSALGNWAERGRLYENYTYDGTTPFESKRHVRVRVMRDSDRFDDGLESEFGAQVTIVPFDHPTDTNRRTKVVSTSAGYLNQNEYVLHFALPIDPDPAPEKDVHFRLIVDFKGTAAQKTVRVDRHVNPVLGDLDLAQLHDREIVVFRSGRVQIDGCDFVPAAPLEPLTTVNESLVLAGLDTPIAAPVPAPSSDWFVGLEIDTSGATAAQRLEEIVLDGKFAATVDCNGVPANFFVWDVTDPLNPVLAAGGLRSYGIRARNDRNYHPLDATLEPGRVYRLAARVQALRATPFAGPRIDGPFLTTGGLSFQDVSPCDGLAIAGATVDPTQIYLTVRFRSEPTGAWADLGESLAGTNGAPLLTMSGDMRPLTFITADVTGALPNAPAWIVVGLTPTCIPFAGGVLVPAPDIVLSGLFSDGNGAFSFSDCIASDVPAGESFFIQAIVLDPGAPEGLAMTNAVSGTTPH
ncbi:MAG: CRTAC1 family protein [Planctomycetes bacterium]|nr:CRTAC1 family protein [Planctomycetota bacterium]